MFKVLVLSYYFPPMGLSGVQRTLKFTKYMKKYNWEPTIITTGNVAYYAHDLALLKEAEDAGLNIERTEAFDPNSLLRKYGTVNMPGELLRKIASKISKTFFIPDNKISWSNKAYDLAVNILSKEHYDVIFVTIPPYSAFDTAIKLKKKFDIPVIVDYRDLWFDNQFAFYPTLYHKIAHKKLEYKCLKSVDKIVTINRRIKEKLLVNYKFLSFEDVVIIPHGFDDEDFKNSVPLPRMSNKMMLTYSGIFYEFITPKYFLNAFKKLTYERPDIAAKIELNFVGHLRKENINLIEKLKLNSYVKDHGYMEHPEAVKRLISSDVLWMMIGNQKNADTISTGKLFEYFGSRKPIIGCVPSGVARGALQEYGASYLTEPDNIEQIKNTLITVYEAYKTNSFPQPNEEFILKHNREYLTDQLTKIFQFYIKDI